MWGLLWHYVLPCLLFLILHFQVIDSSSFNSSSPSAKLCYSEQSSVLLRFKDTISIDNSNFGCEEHSYPKTDSWKAGTDCCSWDGVTCDRFTGHVVGLDLGSSWLQGTFHPNNSLFLLHDLQKLNLACNDFWGSEIPSKFGQFMKLTHLNLSSSDFSGQIPVEIFHLSKLVSLDVSNKFNYASLILSQRGFSSLLQNLTGLRYLNLDSVFMYSVAPSSLMNLSSTLISLCLSNTHLQGKFPIGVFHFPFLQQLSLSRNDALTGNLPNSNWSGPLKLLDLSATNFSGNLFDEIGNLIYLNVLNLAGNNFKGSIPKSLWNLTRITSLDLSFNDFTGQVSGLLSNLGQLTRLHLEWNNFSGLFSDVFGNLSKLTDLDLSQNNFNGQLSSSIFNLTRLSLLYFSDNQLEGHIPCQVSGLLDVIELDLSNNLLSGRIPSWLFCRPSLELLDLGKNKFTGPIEQFQQTSSLMFVFLDNNEIHGPIPNSIFDLLNLAQLDLSSNKLSGIVNSDMFSKLKNLNIMDLSYNSLLSMETYNNINFTLPFLHEFRFSSCNLTHFPNFLRTSKHLEILDLSNNKLVGRISQWELESCDNLLYLNLSHNFLTSFEKFSLMTVQLLDLHSNLLEGPLVFLQAPSFWYLSLSNNKLTGEIPSSICQASVISLLFLSNNSLSGTIPQCLGNSGVEILDLRNNNLQGSILQTFAKDSAMKTLSLNGNQLEGPLPPSLVNCSKLEILDVGNNKINDKFPHWLATLSELQVLILRSNRFHGLVGNSDTKFPFPKLRILDLSHNGFVGLLPTMYFENFKAMMQMGNDNVEVGYMGDEVTNERAIPFQYYSIIVTVKGIDLEMEKILNIFTTIDLSNNKFEDRIPDVIGKLNSLKALNFLHNNLTGRIPSSLCNLTELESLDLSSNKLFGEIPVQLSSLTSLSILNLSYNQLAGPIPEGKQFNTFLNDSFIGNLGLCGLQLSKRCTSGGAAELVPKSLEGDNSSSWFDWKIAMMGYGCGLVIGLSMGYIVFATRKPQWFVRMFERELTTNVLRLNRRHKRRN